ncbi:MFS transporter [Lactobacillus acidophilus]|uniref:MFS transporter n=1 Tax=Lactobacillus acidophilus TaxID=1579 RepID=UPI000354F138|nr:MFS transporter [Lactobacillus acidophilus]MBN3462280.1 multidrug efflux MFS transporter [Lactobacillus acidophilus]MBN3479576.1 multidrug efflux MFS transporter [Lactobacillus acidophilus]MBN3481520.1 multidrug efflux MFS transporter [Lactobacillus acidophilus]MBN3483158.1 multidrug efflux MFS transporter [Lactobacillus acidophilus]MBN3488382.1 multidrug efflux MFS transporter [Lactobacillus acidophilus]
MKKEISLKLIIAILSAGMLSFLGILDETATTVTFPTLIKEFKITTAQVQWVNTIVLLIIAIIVPLSSQIRLRIPTKKIFILGIIFFTLGLLVDIFTSRFDLLLVGRVFQGIGTGIGLPLMYNIILARVPKGRLGFMMGIGTMITAAAVALGPVFGGIVTNFLNWRWIFIISLFFMIISFISGYYSIEQLNKLRKVHLKAGQWLFIAISLVSLMLGFTNLSKNAYQVGGFLLVGMISLYIWGKVSWHDPDALINPHIFKNIAFSIQLICYCFAKISTLALGFIFPIYVQMVNQGTAATAGWIMLPGAIVDAIMAAVAGKILDRKGARLPILVGIIASLVSLFIMCMSSKLPNNMIIWLYVLYYGGYGMSFSSLMTSGLTSLVEENDAQGNTIFNTLQQFSGAIGTALAGTLISISQSNKLLSQKVTTAIGAKWTFTVLLCLLIINLILAMIFVPKNTKQIVKNS